MRSPELRTTMGGMQTIEITDTTDAPTPVGPAFTTLCEAFEATVAAHADRPALRLLGDSEALSWAEYAARAERIAAGLAALGVCP